MSVLSLQEVVRTVASVEGNNVSGIVGVYGIPLELFIALVVIVGIGVVGAVVVFIIKKSKPTPLEKHLRKHYKSLN